MKIVAHMTSFRTPTFFFHFWTNFYFCPHIAESTNIAENARYRRIFLAKCYALFQIHLTNFSYLMLFRYQKDVKVKMIKNILEYIHLTYSALSFAEANQRHFKKRRLKNYSLRIFYFGRDGLFLFKLKRSYLAIFVRQNS